jgi:peptidyl-prolyl cis-trans isomerase NIMA-interacting 1
MRQSWFVSGRAAHALGHFVNDRAVRTLAGVWLVTASTACGGSKAPAKDAEREAAIASEPGIRCIDDAKVRLTPPTDAPERMDLAHILVRHAGVRDAKGATRTREEACLRANEARDKLLAGGDWDAIFADYSDAQGATKGVLYDVTQGSLDSTFAGAAFSLKVDELSHVVETPRGFHVIWRKK